MGYLGRPTRTSGRRPWWLNRLFVGSLLTVLLGSTVVVWNGSLVATLAPLPHPGAPTPKPNLFDPATDVASVQHGAPPKAAPHSAAAPATQARAASPSTPEAPPANVIQMKPALVPADPVAGAHFVGSDGVLQLDAPAGVVTASDVAAGGGKVNLLVRQIVAPSGGNAGGSGHHTFGTWLVQLVDAHGRVMPSGTRTPITLTIHYPARATALDIGRYHMVINGQAPKWVNLDPASVTNATPAPAPAHSPAASPSASPASLATPTPTPSPAPRTALASPSPAQTSPSPSPTAPAAAGRTPKLAASVTPSSSPSPSPGATALKTAASPTASSSASPSPTPSPSSTAAAPAASPAPAGTIALGPRSSQLATANPAAATLSASSPMVTSSSTFSFDANVPVATFGKPDPFTVDLSAGALNAEYPLEVPAGPGGLKPPLNFRYSSASVSGQHNPQGAAPWVGEGWDMTLGKVSWAEVNSNSNCQVSGCQASWFDRWELNDAFGTQAELVGPKVNFSIYTDDTGRPATDPVRWHTVPESHAKVFSYKGPNSISGGSGNPPCFRTYREEFGCTKDSVQYYPEPSGPNQGATYVANWLLDLITDPKGNQIHVTYQTVQDTEGSLTYPRDAQMATVEWDSPSCHARRRPAREARGRP